MLKTENISNIYPILSINKHFADTLQTPLSCGLIPAYEALNVSPSLNLDFLVAAQLFCFNTTHFNI